MIFFEHISLKNVVLNDQKQNHKPDQYKNKSIFVFKSHQIEKNNLLTFRLKIKITNLKMFGYGYGGYGLGGFGGYGGYGWC